MQVPSIAARHRMVRLVSLGLAMAAFGLARGQAVVEADADAAARAVLELDAAFANRSIDVEFIGWRAGDGPLTSALPPGTVLGFPPRLPPSPEPLLPVSLRLGSPTGVLSQLTLEFGVSSEELHDRASLVVRLPMQAVLELEVPDRILVLPGRRAELAVTIRNRGNAGAVAQLEFSGMAVASPAVSVDAGGTRTVRVTLPPFPSGQRSVWVSLRGDERHESHRVLVETPGSASGSGYGLLATATAGLGTEGGSRSGVSNGYGLSARGRLTRNTFVRLELEGESADAVETELLLRFGGTTLEFAPSPQSSPAGNLGRGIYLTQRLADITALGSLDAGLAFPLQQEGRTARFGVTLDGSRLWTNVALGLDGSDPVTEARARLSPFHASLRYTPARARNWLGRIQYATRSLGADLSAWSGPSGAGLGAGARVSLGALGIPASSLSVDLALDLDGVSEAGVRARSSNGSVGLNATRAGVLLEGDYRLALGGLTLELGGAAPLSGNRPGRFEASAGLSLGGVAVTAGGGWSSTDSISFETAAGLARHFGPGSVSAGLRLDGRNLLANGPLTLGAGVEYAGSNGLSGRLDVTLPIAGNADAGIALSASYASFVATPESLVRALDGPDPTARRLRLELAEGAERRPLAGAAIHGCGNTAFTDADGTASLTGPTATCRARIDPSTLPRGTHPDRPAPLLAPGDDVTVTVRPASSLTVSLRYRDAETGELLDAGPEREARVYLEGPERRWVDVELPSGSSTLGDLPRGEYDVRVTDGGAPVRVSLDTDNEELLLTVPAPPRTVLDPSRVTPPVRIDIASVIVTREVPVAIAVSSPAPISRVTVSAGGERWEFGPGGEAGGTAVVPVEFPVPPAARATLEVDIEVEFATGALARRALQLVVVGDPPDAETPPPAADPL